jgi:NAD(P)-dependent dehydrogenase (short-subunit alcohol dehydrogenase family)
MTRRTALVTGASQGIGAAIAEGLARDGFDVAVTSTDSRKLGGVLEKIAANGGRAAAVTLDVRSQASIEQAMSEAVKALGPLDVLVNNAAVPLRRLALEVTREEWANVIDTNATGTFFMTQQMGRHLVAAKRPGCIITISSTHGMIGLAERSVYGISKAAVNHMTRTLAIEWAGYGIRVNGVAPGRVLTDSPGRAASLMDPQYMEAMVARIPLKRFATADEVAAAARYLASPQAGYITGQTIVLDGGLTSY